MKAFFAYSSQNTKVLNNIREVIKKINDTKLIKITSWEDLDNTGNLIDKKVFECIDSNDLFICDLSIINYNVLYELGYAIAKKKRIWITLDPTVENSKNHYRSLPICNIGYAEYNDPQQFFDCFFSEVPYENDSNIYQYTSTEIDKRLLYLQCNKNEAPTNKVTEILEKSNIPLKREDPYEGNELLNWYLDIIPNAVGVVIHFSDRKNEEYNIYDARKAFIAGLALGFNRNTLLLAYSPHIAPLDYKNNLKIHSNSSQCEAIMREWISPIIEKHQENQLKYKDYEADKKALSVLSNLILGDHIAENEDINLIEYFLETSEYTEALTSQQILFVGRKGTGKTANLIKLHDSFKNDKRNFVLVIQPHGHEFEGILHILNKIISSSEQGHLIESIWKYLIYTEISKQYFEYLSHMHIHYDFNKDEEEFMAYFEKNAKFINADFTLRLENIIQDLDKSSPDESLESRRLKISEYLHDSLIRELRVHLGKLLNKKEKVVVLIDNLDKTWSDNENIEQLSSLLFGLLNVTHKISDDFKKQNYKQNSVNLALIVFLRSDIFSRILSFAPEQDKIPFKYLSWSDSSLLFRVIENRINYSSQGITNPDDLWQKYFCHTVNGLPLKTYVEKLILPRPRDIVFLFKVALQEAINRGHTRVEESDFISAEYSYSTYALQSLLPENGGRIKNLESVLYDFAGEDVVLTHSEVINCLTQIPEEKKEDVIEILCDLTFLGKEIKTDIFEFYSEKRNAAIINKLATKLATRNQGIKRYKINSAFHSYLEISK